MNVMAAICNSFSGRRSFASLSRSPGLNERAPVEEAVSQPISFERNVQMVAGQVIHTNYYSRNYFPGHYCNSSADTETNVFERNLQQVR